MAKEHKNLFHDVDEMEEGDFEGDVYTDKGREELVNSDEIDEVEEGFMEGFDHGEELTNCAECGKVLVDENFVEEEFHGHSVRFCSKLCAMRYEEKH